MVSTQFVRVRRCPFELVFHFVRCFPGRKSGPVRDAENMRINGDGWLPEGLIQNHIRGLAANTWQQDQLFPRLRHLAPKIIKQHLRQSDHILRLVSPKANCLDMPLDTLKPERQHLLWRIRNRKQPPRRLVHANIGRLCRQGDSNHQRIGRGKFQLSMRIRPHLCQRSIKLGRLVLIENRTTAFLFTPLWRGFAF